MRVLVCGGRDFTDSDFVHNTLCEQHALCGPFTAVIHGCATGADSEAANWAEMMGIKQVPYRAEWRKYGKAAGPLRNQRMLEQGKPDMVIAFSGGRGTEDMTRRAQTAGVPVVFARLPPLPGPREGEGE